MYGSVGIVTAADPKLPLRHPINFVVAHDLGAHPMPVAVVGDTEDDGRVPVEPDLRRRGPAVGPATAGSGRVIVRAVTDRRIGAKQRSWVSAFASSDTRPIGTRANRGQDAAASALRRAIRGNRGN
jgi:hypothetical protein